MLTHKHNSLSFFFSAAVVRGRTKPVRTLGDINTEILGEEKERRKKGYEQAVGEKKI